MATNTAEEKLSDLERRISNIELGTSNNLKFDEGKELTLFKQQILLKLKVFTPHSPIW